jgi:hypothetical protein
MNKKSKNNDNYDVIGGIFDFIFAESKKPPEKRKRITPEKEYVSIPGNEAVVEDILTVLSAPGVFLTSTAPQDVWDALDLDLINIPIDENGGIKITTGNVKDLFKDPGAFVDKMYKKSKAIRKANQALYLGGALSGFMTTAWAREYGNQEVFKASLATSVAEKKDQSYKISRALGQYAESRAAYSDTDSSKSGMGKPPSGLSPEVPQTRHETHLDYMAERSVDLVGQKTFGRNDWKNMSPTERSQFISVLSGQKDPLEIIGERTFGPRWKSMSEEEKLKRKRQFSSLAERDNTDGFARANIQKYLANKYGVQTAKKFGNVTRGNTIPKGSQSFSITNKSFGDADSINIFDPTLYRSVERNNLVEKMKTSTGKEKALYQRTLLMLEANKKGVRERLDFLRSQLSSTNDLNAKRDIRNEIKQVEKLSNLLNSNNFFARVGQLEGYLNSVKGVWVGKDVNPIKSIWDQSFFDSRRNKILNPVKGSRIGEMGKGSEMGREVGFVVAKQSDKKDVLNAYNKFGESLYYANPRTWVRSFVTGEGFAWIANKNIEGAKRIVKDLNRGEDIIKSMDSLLKTCSIKDLEKNIEEIMKKINLQNGQATLSSQQLAKIESLLKNSKVFRRLADVFSAPLRLKNRIAEIIVKRTKEIRRAIVRKIMKSKFLRDIIIKHGGSKLLGKFIAQGSIKVLIQGVVSSIGASLGLVGGPLAIVTFVVTWVATEIAWRVGKVLIKIQIGIIKFTAQLFLIFMFGILGILLMIVSVSSKAVSDFNKMHYSYSNVIPGDVKECDAYDLELPESGADIIPPKMVGDCFLGEGHKPCPQGWSRSGRCFSHNYGIGTLMLVDLFNVSYVWGAKFCDEPEAECKIINSSRIPVQPYAGDQVKFSFFDGETKYEFFFLHLKLLSGYSEGSTIKAEEPFAEFQDGLAFSDYWRGKHLHIETISQNGALVNPLHLLTEFNCDVPPEVSGCNACNEGF